MREIFDQVIASGAFDLTDLLYNIDRYHIEGKLTDDDRAALYEAAYAAVKPQYNYTDEIDAIWVEIRNLQNSIKALSGTTDTSTSTTTEEEYPEYVQPTGGHDAYQVGDKVTYNGKKYTCALNNCVWNPADYPAAWTEVTE